ncbi:MAG TPA: GAF domain-containing protein [Chloroflexota bacterium]
MDVKRLRLVTIVGPIAFLLVVEAFSIFVLFPLLGSNALLRLLIIFALLMVVVIPFSFWVFGTLERQQQSLRESAITLQNVKDHAIFMLDPQGRIMTWSHGAEELKGYTAQEVLGQYISIFYSPEDVERGMPQLNLADAVRGRAEFEGWRVRKDGSQFWANVVSTAVRDDSGTLLGFTHVVRDMSDRREAEKRIRKLNDALEQRVRQLDAANRAITAVSSALDLSHVLQSIADAARDLVNSRYAALGVVDEKGHIVQFITSGMTEKQRRAIGPLPQGHGLLGALIRDSKPLRVSDIAQDPRRHGFPPNHPAMKSLLGAPILFKDRAIGDLYVADKIGAGEFSQEDQDLLVLLANHAAVAIENARLHEEVRSARDRLQVWNERLEARVAERAAEIERYSKELTTRVLQAQEEERKRLARELHDDTAQSLSTLLINLDVIEPGIPRDNVSLQAGFERIRSLTKRTLDAVRALSHDLRPTILDDFGLVAALRWFGAEYTNTFDVPVDVKVEGLSDVRLAPEVELALFRIAQEALTNVGKYAGASYARVLLSYGNGAIRLEVEDDGKGFDPRTVSRPTRHGGLGLYGMRERAALLNATLDIDSAPGKGTRVTVVIPPGPGIGSELPTRVDANGSAALEGAEQC